MLRCENYFTTPIGHCQSEIFELDRNSSEYLRECSNAFEQACRPNVLRDHTLHIAQMVVRLRFAGPALETAILPALAHLICLEQDAVPEITFHLWDGASTGIYPPRPPFTAGDYHRYGQRAFLGDDEWAILHAPVAGTLCAYDRSTRQGYFWTPDAAQLSIYERAAPLQTLFHWAFKEFGWQIVHAAAIGTERGGTLLVGSSGAGKSTTALTVVQPNSSQRHTLRYLCDDKCLVRLDPKPQAFGLYCSAKLKRDMLDRLPFFGKVISSWDDLNNPSKALAFVHPHFSAQMVRTFPIRAILLPHIAHRQQPQLLATTASAVFRVFGPSTAIWLPGAEADNYRFLAQLVSALPCYLLELAENPTDNVRIIEQTLDATYAE